METAVLSTTVQEFNGERFYLCGRYFQHNGKRLHKTVWEYHHGVAPAGSHVHHKDGNRANNSIENLELLTASEHLSIHAKSHTEHNQQHIKDMQELAKEWHGSSAGYKWHSQHAKSAWTKAVKRQYTCTECGCTFETRHAYGAFQHTFCSGRCKARYYKKAAQHANQQN